LFQFTKESFSHSQGRNEGGHNCLGAEKSQALPSVQQICFRKSSGSNTGTPNLLLTPGAI